MSLVERLETGEVGLAAVASAGVEGRVAATAPVADVSPCRALRAALHHHRKARHRTPGVHEPWADRDGQQEVADVGEIAAAQ